jgi:hypothetical protein
MKKNLTAIITLMLILLSQISFSYTKTQIIKKVNQLAQQIKTDLNNNQLSEAQIYTYITELTTYDKKVYGSALAFNPSFFQGHAFFLYQNVTPNNKILYSPYVDKGNNAILKAMDVGHITQSRGYDYTAWEWYRIPMQTQKPYWTKPYFDKGAGNIMMVTYSIPIGKIAILTFDLPYKKNN